MSKEWLVQLSSIRQMKLLDNRALESFAHDRGLTPFVFGVGIRELWQIGWLNADLVEAQQSLDWPGLVLVGQDASGWNSYVDERTVSELDAGWVDAIADLEVISGDVKLYFHPFRYYVLYHIDRVLHLHISPMQMLLSTEAYPRLLQYEITQFQRWSAGQEFPEIIHKWNRIAELAAATEPCFYEQLFGIIKASFFEGVDEQRRRIADHWSSLVKWYQKIGLETVEKYRQELCIAAESLDPNKNLHTTLRLTHGESRIERIKGKIGGALLLLTMAEMLRRAAEEVFERDLREEDELGFGSTPIGLKERLYGASRLLDAKRSVKTQFVREFGLDYGVRLRWYVEGDTEYSAIGGILGQFGAVELVNLRGQVAARHGKGFSFRDDLRNDLKAQRFSFVSIDSDRSDYLLAARKAAEDDEICGAIFVSAPEFESANFTLAELEEVLHTMAIDSAEDDREQLDTIAKIRARKGKEWGEKLMTYAWEHPEKIDEHTGKSKIRPIIEAIDMAVRSIQVDYHLTRKEFRVDPITGRPVKRNQNNSVPT